MTIRRRVVLLYLLTLVPMLVLVLGLLAAWYGSQRDLVSSGRRNNARLLATAFSTTVDDLSSAGLAVGEAALTYEGVQPQPALERLVTTHPLHLAAVLDEKGMVTSASDANLVGTSIEDTAVARVRGGQEDAISVSRELSGLTGFVVARRLADTSGREHVVVLFVDPVRLSARLAQNPIGGGAHVVDSAGQLVVIFEHAEMTRNRPYWGGYGFIRRALNGRDAVDFDWTFPPTGVRRVAAAVPIRDLGWEAGSAVDYEDAFAPFQRTLANAAMFGALVLLVSGLAVRRYAGRMITAVDALAEQSAAIGDRDREPRPVVRTGDEIELVSEALGRADRDLRAYIGGIEMIGDAGRRLSASSTTGRVNETIVDAARRLFDASAVWLFLFDESDRVLKPLLWYSEAGAPGPSRGIRPGEGVAGRVFATGEVALIPDINAVDGFAWRRTRTPGVAEALVEIPLLQANKPIGVLGVFAPGIERWQLGGREIGMLEAFGAQVSIALQNSRLFETERTIAETLQQALLIMPEHVERVSFAHAYYSGTDELRVGGDFYDLFELGEGLVGLLIGDVAGKGLQAAVLTSLVKDTVRAHADASDKTPAEVAALTNRLLIKESPPDMFVTLFLGYLDTKRGSLVYCNAGHTTAARIAVSSVGALSSTSPVVGVFDEFEYSDAEEPFAAGDTLLLYTDGLTEARNGRDLYGEERLFQFLGTLRNSDPEAVVGQVHRQVLAYSGGTLNDDLALLAVSIER